MHVECGARRWAEVQSASTSIVAPRTATARARVGELQRRGTRWARHEIRPRFLQAPHVRRHALTDEHNMVMAARLALGKLVRIVLQYCWQGQFRSQLNRAQHGVCACVPASWGAAARHDRRSTRQRPAQGHRFLCHGGLHGKCLASAGAPMLAISDDQIGLRAARQPP